MVIESRTSKSIKNSVIALGFYFVNLMLQFFSRKIFLEYLGTEILGLNTTASNLLQFLNLAELGISSAVGFTLYKPLYEKDYDTINEIVTLQGHLYKRIGIGIIIGAAILMCFFPMIFKKIELPLWYAYASFGVLLFSALLGYFVNYRQIVLSANQEDYKIQYSFKSVLLLKLGVQIIAVKYMQNGYLWWLVLEVIFSLMASICLAYITKKSAPFLTESKNTFRTLREKYSGITIRIKQLFFHQVSGFVLTQTSPLIIFAYMSLTEVTFYGNYMIIMLGGLSLMTSVFNSTTAGVGNLIVESDKIKILSVFEELFSIRFWFGATVCFGVYYLTPSFISLWIGSEYLLSNMALGLMTVTLFFNIIRLGAGTFLSSMGIYSDIWAPVIETFLNLGLSIVLGHFWGLNGILTGVLISVFLIPICWKAFYLFKKGFKAPVIIYIKTFIKHFISAAICWIICIPIVENVDIIINSYYTFMCYAGVIVLSYSMIYMGGLFLINAGIKMTLKRMITRLK